MKDQDTKSPACTRRNDYERIGINPRPIMPSLNTARIQPSPRGHAKDIPLQFHRIEQVRSFTNEIHKVHGGPGFRRTNGHPFHSIRYASPKPFHGGSYVKWNDSKMDLLFRNMVVMLSLLLAIYITYSNRHFFHDDAYITLRYARNYLSGYGFVWNPGETIQGYTSFLHLFILTFLGRFGVDLVLAAHLIGFTALAALLGVMILTGIAIRNESGFPAWYLPPILVVTSAPLLVWALGGLEGTLFSLCVAAGSTLILCTSSASGKSWLYLWSGFLGGICFLARPDGIIVIFVSLFYHCLSGRLVDRKSVV